MFHFDLAFLGRLVVAYVWLICCQLLAWFWPRLKYLLGFCLGLGMMDLSWLSTILFGAGCLAFGYCIGKGCPACFFVSVRRAKNAAVANENKKNKAKEPLEIEKLADILDDFKMVWLLLFSQLTRVCSCL